VKRGWIEWEHPALSVSRQCALLGLARSTAYYTPTGESAENLRLMRRLDELYTRRPFYGRRRMAVELGKLGHVVNEKRVARLLAVMGLEAVYPRRRLSMPAAGEGHRIYPYLLRGVPIERTDHVWSTDITYIRLRQGCVYLVAVLDWFSRYVLAWELSSTLETEFCVAALEWALRAGRPTIFNTDQGAQFTSHAFTDRLEAAGVQISMDGRGRALDNVFVERLWRTVKYEEVYLRDYGSAAEARTSLGAYFRFYNHERPHQALGYRTPEAVYRAAA
jgi:putative transposase